MVCSSSIFTISITLLIIANTVVLASDSYPEDRKIADEAAAANDFFTFCFLAEMIIKLLGLGPKAYTKEGFNLFDAAIVVLSMIEFAIEH